MNPVGRPVQGVQGPETFPHTELVEDGVMGERKEGNHQFYSRVCLQMNEWSTTVSDTLIKAARGAEKGRAFDRWPNGEITRVHNVLCVRCTSHLKGSFGVLCGTPGVGVVRSDGAF